MYCRDEVKAIKDIQNKEISKNIYFQKTKRNLGLQTLCGLFNRFMEEDFMEKIGY